METPATPRPPEGRLRSTELWATSLHRVTRLQISKIVCIFPFLELPAELRNIIYSLCFDFRGIETFFNSYYRELSRSKGKKPSNHRKPRKGTPNVFLINRQIFHEVSALLPKCAIKFHHGLLRTPHVSDVVSHNILKQVSYIEVSDAGHSILAPKTLSDSWHGYLRLIKELASVLATGHHLRKLVLRFTDPRLLPHTTTCSRLTHRCGYRDDLKRAMNTMQRVHGVSQAQVIGLDHEFTVIIRRKLESRAPDPLARLPREVRDMIWGEAVKWPNTKAFFSRITKKMGERDFIMLPRQTSTPTALLLNRQYHAEANEVLMNTPLVIEFPDFTLNFAYIQYFHFFTEITGTSLRRAQHINIRMAERDLFAHIKHEGMWKLHGNRQLHTLSLHFEDNEKTHVDKYPDKELHSHFIYLQTLRYLKKVEITGSLPEEYTGPMIQMMKSDPFLGLPLSTPKAVDSRTGEVVNLDPISAADLPRGMMPVPR